MANCISCGKEAGEGQFFCSECYAQMTPDKTQPTQPAQPAPQASSAAPSQPETVAKPEVVEPAVTQPEAEPEPAKPRIDAEKSKVLTPPSEKKKMPPAGEPAKPRIDTERSKALTPASEKKAVKAESAPVGTGAQSRPGPRPAKAKKLRNEAGVEAPPAASFKEGMIRQGDRLRSTLKAYRAKAYQWVKEQAFHERCSFDRTGWVSWSTGVAASVVFLVSVLFIAYYEFDWILTGSQAVNADSVSIHGVEMGAWGVLLVIDAILLLLLYAWSLAGFKWTIKMKINPDFLAACLSILGVLLVFLAIRNSAALKGAISQKTGLSYSLIEPGAVEYSKDKMSYGPYVSAFALLIVFMASASRLSEKGASSKLGKKLSAWYASKKSGSHA